MGQKKDFDNMECMNNKYYVEDCITITPKELLSWVNIKNGTRTDTKWSDINCRLDSSDPDILCISVKGGEPQRIVFEWVDINFGQVAYFQCNCGCRASKLYLPPNSVRYRCRKCHNLKYRLSSLNSKSVAGRVLYKFNRMNKLIETRENIKRVFYKGKYTRRFKRFLRLCENAGIDSVVEDAKNLLDVMKNPNIF